MGPVRVRRPVVPLALALLVAPLLLPAWPAQGSITTHQVRMENVRFNPASLTVKVGDTVTWTNYDEVEHDVVVESGPEKFSSRLFGKGKSFSHTFTKAGTYSYYCSPHRNLGMTGTIVAEPAPAATSTGPTTSPQPPAPSPTATRAVVPPKATPGSTLSTAATPSPAATSQSPTPTRTPAARTATSASTPTPSDHLGFGEEGPPSDLDALPQATNPGLMTAARVLWGLAIFATVLWIVMWRRNARARRRAGP